MAEIDTQLNTQNKLQLYKNFIPSFDEAIKEYEAQGNMEYVKALKKSRGFYLDRIRELEGNKGA